MRPFAPPLIALALFSWIGSSAVFAEREAAVVLVGPGSLDLDQNGTGDVLSAAVFEDLGPAEIAGLVSLIPGTPSGIGSTGWSHLRQGAPPTGGTPETGAYFGSAMAGGDFNGDGRPDVALGAPGSTVNGETFAGQVHVYYNTGHGVGPAQIFHQDTPGVADEAEGGDRFGGALAAVDFNGDRFDDLAIGVGQESFYSASGNYLASAGAVHVIYGSPLGLVPGISSHEFFDQRTQATTGAFWGSTLAAMHARSPAPGRPPRPAMLFVGAPGFDAGGMQEAGSVTVLLAQLGIGVRLDNARTIDQDTLRMGDQSENGDKFGTVIVPTGAPCTGGPGGATLGSLVLFGVPDESRGNAILSGLVHATCVSHQGAVLQDRILIPPGPPQAVALFGSCVASVRIEDGPKVFDVVFPGSPLGRTNGPFGGVVHQFALPSKGAALHRGTLNQDSPGVPGVSADGNLFGRACAVHTVRNGVFRLVIGSPGETVAGAQGAGALYSTSLTAKSVDRLSYSHFQRLVQRQGEMPEAGDQFGSGLQGAYHTDYTKFID